MLLTQLPDSKAAPLSAQINSALGRESILMSGSACTAEFGPEGETGCLAVKAACNGRVHYAKNDGELTVDDDVYLILNPTSRFVARIASSKPVYSFSVFFRVGLPEEVLSAQATSADRILDDPESPAALSIRFAENLAPHDRLVSPILKYLSAVCRTGFDDSDWFDEQLRFLLDRMLVGHRKGLSNIEKLRSARHSTRVELHRRLNQARDFIQSCYERSLDLRTIADRACLSPHHFLRLFKSVYGVTPHQYLLRKRVTVASRLLVSNDNSITEVAAQVGFDSRSTLFRSFRKIVGMSPAAFRAQRLNQVNGAAIGGGSNSLKYSLDKHRTGG